MTKDNEDALRCAERLLTGHTTQYNANEAAAHLRRLVQENGAKDALMRQTVEIWDSGQSMFTAVAAIRQHLKKST